jgi:hypothetical protein
VSSPISNGAAAAFRAPSLVATFLGALEIVLDRALNDDWVRLVLYRRGRGCLRAGVRADDPMGGHPP